MKRILEVCLMLSLVAPALAGTRRDIPKVNSTRIPHDTDGRIHHMEESMYDACVGWWNFDKDEATQYDASPAGNDMSLIGTTWSSEGGGSHDTTSGVISNVTMNVPNLSHATYSMWSKSAASGTGYEMLFCTYSASGVSEVTFYTTKAGQLSFLHFETDGSPRSWTMEDVPFIPDGRWHHTCVSYDASDQSATPLFMVDGLTNGLLWTLGSPADSAARTNVFSTFVGTSQGGALHWDGYADEVCIWSNLYDATELNAWYHKNEAAKKVVDPNAHHLIAWWNFEQYSVASPYRFPAYGPNNTQLGGWVTNNPAGTGATWSTNGAVFNHYLDFDGSDDYLLGGHLDALDGATEISFSSWVWTDKWSGDYGYIFDNGDVDGYLGEEGPGTGFESNVWFSVTDGESPASIGKYYTYHDTIATGSWEHVVWTFSNGYSEIYINNEAKTVYEIITGSRPTYIDDSTEALKLGNAGAVFLDGRLDNVAFYGKVLTAAEVDWLYDNTCPTNCLAY